ncbi:MAG: TldD/PmbA family protein [Candidatus Heimdallarchaeota archaeon]|nr:TldD/PmbA family protein [Candidatus Heimdallarchaeota archaeon]
MTEVLADLALTLAEKMKIDATEVFVQSKEIKKIEISKGLIKQAIEQEKSGIAIRSVIDDQMSFVSSNAANKINEILELSVQNAKTSTQKVSRNFVNRKFITPVQEIRDNRLRDLSLEDICDRVSEILSSIELSKPVKNIDGVVAIETEERLIANSEGLWKREVGTRLKADILTTTKVDDFIGMGSGHLASRVLQEDWQKLFNTSIKTAYDQRNRKKMTIGRPRGVIFSPESAAQILAHALIPSFHYTSGSHYYESFRNCRFNKNIVMTDDPTYPGAQNTFGFDDEGYPSKPRDVLSGGKCKQLLGMNFSCPELDKKEVYRGNCYRVAFLSNDTRSYVYPPTVSSSNFVIKAKKPLTEPLAQELNSGIYIKEIVGAQDANYYTGDFVVSVIEGYEIKNGEILNPILPCYCSGNIYRMLEDSSLIIGNQLQEVPIRSTPLNVLMPEILSTRMTISI